MLTRRDAVGAIGAVVAGSTVGCLDAVPFLGDDPIEFEASLSTVPPAVLGETGYEEHKREEVVIERTFEAAGQSQDVVVTNWQVEYDKAVDLGEAGLPVEQRLQAAIFTALTTPQVDVLGRTFNPVADMDSADLAAMVQDRYEGMGALRQVGEDTATVVGQSTTVGEFETEADLVGAGVTVDLTLHLAEAVESGDDLIVAIGGYPTVLRNHEKANIFSMMEGIEHDG